MLDRFVCGLRNKKTLMETGLTFSKALEIAKSLETVAKDAQQLKGSEQAGTVHNVASRLPGKRHATAVGGQTTRPAIVRSKELYVIIVVKGGISRGGTSNHKGKTKEETGGGKKEPSGWTQNRVLRKTHMVDTHSKWPEVVEIFGVVQLNQTKSG